MAIARAIIPEPALLLADEPTGNLDPALAVDILGLFEEIQESGTTVLFATHDRTLIEGRTRRVIVLDEGKALDAPRGLEQWAELPDAQYEVDHPPKAEVAPRSGTENVSLHGAANRLPI